MYQILEKWFEYFRDKSNDSYIVDFGKYKGKKYIELTLREINEILKIKKQPVKNIDSLKNQNKSELKRVFFNV